MLKGMLRTDMSIDRHFGVRVPLEAKIMVQLEKKVPCVDPGWDAMSRNKEVVFLCSKLLPWWHHKQTSPWDIFSGLGTAEFC